MKEQKICIEHELHCKSANIIWPLISTPAGLAKWVADDVRREGEKLIFTWGDMTGHHEIRMAVVAGMVKNDHIKMYWDDSGDDSSYCMLSLDRSDITGDYILIITDFAPKEDVETLKELWYKNLSRLRHATGL